MDIVEITPDDIDIKNIDSNSNLRLSIENDSDNEIENSKPSVNFGTGIELLMNDKNINEKKSSQNIEIDDITKLEDELNDLTTSNTVSKEKKLFTNIFSDEKKNGENIKIVTENNNSEKEDNLGKSTSKLNENKSWDGFGKFNNIPTNIDSVNKKPELTREEEMREKFKYIRKLEELEKKGVSLSKRYNMDSDLQEMIGEYETIVSEKEKSNAVKFQGKMLMACITGIEFLNNKFDPFDIKLEGWGEQINENIDEYDEIFGELHEKYKSKAKMSPELKLLFQLGGSAMMVHMSNTLFKSSMPGMDDIMRQNPELMKQFTQAAVNTMGQSKPGFGGFMNSVFQSRENGVGSGANPGFGTPDYYNREMPPNVNIGPPPSPTETKLPERSQRMQNMSNRPDIMSARGVSLDNESNINENENITRPEMKGPSKGVELNNKQREIQNILGGLKPKQQINVNENNEASTISIEDLKELTGAKIPKSKRRQKSDKAKDVNIVSLDI